MADLAERLTAAANGRADWLGRLLREAAQGIAARSDETRSGSADRPGPATQDAPNHGILKGDAGQPNKRGATSHDRNNTASGEGSE